MPANRLSIRVRRAVRCLAHVSATLLAAGVLWPASAAAGTPAHRAKRGTVSASSLQQLAESGPAAPGESTTSESGTSRSANGLGRRCRMSVQASASRITAGESVVLSGELVCPEAASAAEQPVIVYAREHRGGASGLSEVASTSTEVDGSFGLTVAGLQANTTLYVRAQQARAHISVKVAPVVTLYGPAGTTLFTRGGRRAERRLGRFTFTGIAPDVAVGARVALQCEYGTSGEWWRTIAVGRVGAEGRFTISHGFRSAGLVSVRAVVHPKARDGVGISQPLSYDITQAQSPALTIQSSADPVSSGQAVTITGIAAGGAGQAVTLRARTRGHALVTVAEGLTGSGGRYAFTVSPLQDTRYLVAATHASSSELFEGVRYQLIPAAAAQTVQEGQPLTLSGTLLGAPSGQIVYLERADASGLGGFHVVAEGSVGADSTYSIADTFSAVGKQILRIKVPAGSRTVGVSGEQFTVTVLAVQGVEGEASTGASTGEATP